MSKTNGNSETASGPFPDPATMEAALQQIRAGLNAFLLVQQVALQQQIGGSAGEQVGQRLLAQFAHLNSSTANDGGTSTSIDVPMPANKQIKIDEEKRQRDLTIIGKRWQYVSDVSSFAEFEQLRCRHQVSRNRTFAHGIRYSCTQKTQLRSNCPYLLLCLFSDGAGEHSTPGVGTISVYSRNEHTHPVKSIKARQPRRFAKFSKKRAEGEKVEGGREEADRKEEGEANRKLNGGEIDRKEEGEANWKKDNDMIFDQQGEKVADQNETVEKGQVVDPSQLIQMLAELSKQLANQAQNGEK